MIKHFIKYAVRFFWRNKLFSLINIGGLTLGLSCFVLIINFVQYELSYDSFHHKSENLYRVNLISKATGNKSAAVGPPIGPRMLEEFPEVESFVRLRHADNSLVSSGGQEYFEKKVFFVDSSFFSIFNFTLKEGDRNTTLDEINTGVISSEIAQKYFGEENAIGKVIKLDNDRDIKITGVVADSESPSHFKFDILVSFTSFIVPQGYPVTLDTWGWVSFPTYIRLKPNTQLEAINAKFDDFIFKVAGERGRERMGFELQRLDQAYLYSKDVSERNGIDTKGDIDYVAILVAIAFLILLIAGFNFANLSTSLSLKRMREIGVRKVLGARRKVVFSQYFLEALFLVVVSFLLSLMFLEVFSDSLLRLFNAPFDLTSNMVLNSGYYLIIILLLSLVGGIYPAVRLSDLSPVKALKNKVDVSGKKINVKTLLIGVQFAISILLIVASVVINDQMTYMNHKDLGYDREFVVGLRIDSDVLDERYSSIKQQLLDQQYISSLTVSDDFFDGQNGSTPVQEVNNDETDHRISLFTGHYDFTKTLGIELVEGRDFSEEFSIDSTGFILNESAVKMFGWSDSPIGKNILLNNTWQGEVIGVVKDFNFASLHREISPLIISMPRNGCDNIYLKINEGNISERIAQLEADWKSINPDLPFDYTFLDSHVDNMYKSDQKFSSIVFTFSGLAIFLACMGLYGMVAYSIDTKQKEIGVRKVLGASVLQIVSLLSRQFVVLITLAALVAFPAAWMFLDDWLSEFAYRIDISPFHLTVALISTILIVGLTLSAKTISAAQANPVDTLKEE